MAKPSLKTCVVARAAQYRAPTHPAWIDSGTANGGRRIERDVHGRFAVRNAISFIILGFCLYGTGCAPPTVWNAEVRSPDGHSIAVARTVQNGGFGTASIDTTVYLKSTQFSNPPAQVLGFSCQGPVPRPYVLDNVANAGGTINLTMKWLTSSHLEVTYNGRNGSLDFQVVKIRGIEISVRDLSGVKPN
jgi:hypothetical protein